MGSVANLCPTLAYFRLAGQLCSRNLSMSLLTLRQLQTHTVQAVALFFFFIWVALSKTTVVQKAGRGTVWVEAV